MSKRYGVISIGTNSSRVLLADIEPERPRIEVARSVGTRIGEGLGESGRLGDEPMQRTLDAVEQLAQAIRGHYVRLIAVGTSALRRADNATEFADRVRALLGVGLRILSGEEEAAASYRGALSAVDNLHGDRLGVVDVGGGSTEYAAGTSLVPDAVVSCEIGAVRLTEVVSELSGSNGAVDAQSVNRASEAARDALKPLAELPHVERVALVGGSATTAAAIVRGQAGSVWTYPLTKSDLQRTLESLLNMTLEERKRVPGMRAQRADILPAGLIVLNAALDVLGHDRVVATRADLLLGVLLQERDAAGQPQRLHGGSERRRGFKQ